MRYRWQLKLQSKRLQYAFWIPQLGISFQRMFDRMKHGRGLSSLEQIISSNRPSPSLLKTVLNKMFAIHEPHVVAKLKILSSYQDIRSVFLKADSRHWVVDTVKVDWFTVPSVSYNITIADLWHRLSVSLCCSSTRDHHASKLVLGGVANSNGHHSTCHDSKFDFVE